jgi:hypothetical protein
MGIDRVEVGRSLPALRPSDETHYYNNAEEGNTASVFDPSQQVPWHAGGDYIEAMAGAGGWIASAVDMVRFLNAADGFTTVPDFLNASSMTHMTTRASASYSLDNSDDNYARGWAVFPQSQGAVWTHVGKMTGSRTIIVRTPDEYTYALLLNIDPLNGSGPIDNAVDDALDAAINNISEWPEDLFSRYQ